MSDGSVYWTSMCGNATVRHAFWNYKFMLDTPHPDLTDCFQHTVLSWFPCFVVWLSTLFYLPYLVRKKSVFKWAEASRLNALKTALSEVLAVFAVIRLVYSAIFYFYDDQFTLAQVMAPAVFLLTQILVSFLIGYEYVKGIGSSGVLFCYWLTVVLCDAVQFRSLSMRGTISHLVLYVIFYIDYALIIMELLLHLWSDHKATGAGHARDLKENGLIEEELKRDHYATESKLKGIIPNKKQMPETGASFLNRLTWFWVVPLLITGFKKRLPESEVWDLRTQDRVRPVLKKFYKSWILSSKNKQTKKAAPNVKYYGSLRGDDVFSDSEASHSKYDDGDDHEDAKSQSLLLPLKSMTDKQMNLQKHKAGEFESWELNSGLVSSLWKSFGLYYSLLGIYEILIIILTFLRPVLFSFLIRYADSGPTEIYYWQGLLACFLLFMVTLIRSLLEQKKIWNMRIVAERTHCSLAAALYRKTLLLSNSGRKEYSAGEIINLMAVDSQRIADLTFFIHTFWSAPVNIAVAMLMLWSYLGIASLAGLAALLFLMGLNGFMATKVEKFQVEQMEYKDKRTKMINEILNGIKTLKLYAWEGAFMKNVAIVRELEVKAIKMAAYLLGGAAVSFNGAPLIFAIVSFATFVAIFPEYMFTAQVAFVSLSLVHNITKPLTLLPNGIANLVQALVSVKRIEKFLNNEELKPDSIERTVHNKSNAIEIEHGTFSWDKDLPAVIKSISFNVKKGSFVAIVGQVGVGKSSLMNAMLGELHKDSGRVGIEGSVAYVPQEAWIRNENLEQNILFGTARNEKRYQKVLQACALLPDLEQLPDRDQTEIGEKGINLSGGQKQRVSLARAVYQDRDIYLLDDPLSAVDVHVGKHLYDNVIGENGILRKKTRVLVTHALTHLQKADLIICLKDGYIAEMGGYSALLSRNGDFAELVKTYVAEENSDEEESDTDVEMRRRYLTSLSSAPESDYEGQVTRRKAQRSKKSRRKSTKSQSDMEEAEARKMSEIAAGTKLIEKESSESGGVNFNVMLTYMKSLSYQGLALLFISYVIYIATDLGSNIWLSRWSDPDNKMDSTLRLGVYGSIGVAQTLSLLVHVFSLAVSTAVASTLLHNKLMHCIVRCPMAFFDTTPVGRILNRFSTDMNIVDNMLRVNLMAVIRGTAIIFTTVVAISYTAPLFLAAMIPLSVAYYFIRKIYVTSSNQLRRMKSVRTSPVFSHFGETINGAASIRAYQAQERFSLVNDLLVDDVQKPRYAAIIANRWMSVALEILGSAVVLFASLQAVIGRGYLHGGLVGLSISYALQVTDVLALFVKNTSDFENNIVSVERILEYTKLDSEAPLEVPEHKPDSTWPRDGKIQLSNYSTRYRAGLDLVLRELTLDALPEEKIGIVGRTGAGKSSMMLAFFRLIEPAEGKIFIDGVDVTQIGLHDLRSKITIIPQDPVIFSGTLRMNLDPFSIHTDTEVWKALENAHLKTYVAGLPEGLAHYTTEGGSNLSTGQKQLMCLARALLRKTKLLVLDEATAAVDLETDDLIQATIRTEFQHCTILTIAHRLSTVIDYDRIMVLDNGRIKEIDSPGNLLKDTKSSFYSMAKDANLV